MSRILDHNCVFISGTKSYQWWGTERADKATMLPSEIEGEEEEGVDEEKDRGITRNRVATEVRMANEIHLVAQELEPLVFPTLHFSNIIERGMSVYKESCRPEEKQHRQLPVSMFCSQTPAPKPWLEEISYSRAAPGGRGVVMESQGYAWASGICYVAYLVCLSLKLT